MSAANAIATAAAAAAVLSKYNLGSSSGEQEYWESDETWPEVLPAYIDQDVPAESSTGPMAVDVGERVLSSRQEAEKSPTSMDRSAVRRGGVGPYNDSSVQRYPGSDEEDCEEDCEFTFDDDSGDDLVRFVVEGEEKTCRCEAPEQVGARDPPVLGSVVGMCLVRFVGW